MSRAWILPMAGQGTRVRALGECKPAIVVAGRPIVAWCLTGLSRHVAPGDLVVAITTAYFEKVYDLSTVIKYWLDRLEMPVAFRLVAVEETPPGPAATVSRAQNVVPGDVEVVCVNVDQYCEFEFPENDDQYDAFVPLYVNTNGKSSYALIQAGRITRVEEKKQISCYASAGVYGFRDADVLFSAISQAFLSAPNSNGEYFIGPTINRMITDGLSVVPSTVVAKFDLGDIPGIDRFRKIVRRWHT